MIRDPSILDCSHLYIRILRVAATVVDLARVKLQLRLSLPRTDTPVQNHTRGGSLFWWFEKTGKYLRYEAKARPDGGYELRVINPDGTEHVELFDDSNGLSRRQKAFEGELASDGWNGPHGWNL